VTPTVTVSGRGESRIRGGHLWIYRSDVAAAEAAAGDTVRVVGPRGRTVGHALWSDRSQIALRFLTRGDAPAGLDLWRTRIDAAIRFRESLAIEATAYRLIHGEGDLLSSLVVDRYGGHLVVQTLSQGTDRLLPEIVGLLVERLSPAGILARNDARSRILEGLEQKVEVVYGEVPQTIEVEDGGVRYDVDPRRGQKTGAFLDQRENRVAAAAYARGRLLDCFSYDGGFALALARRCDETVAVEISGEAVARIRRNAERNGITNIEAVAANAFDYLREADRRGERFDTIVLDPPGFAPNRAALDKALGGYKEINLRALKLLEPGGTLVTASCSYHVDEATFEAVAREAAADARADVSLLEKRGQSRDHPVLLGVPETRYLKCLVVRKLG
jgi:23S rRNA (cytosine1962-C5)-methyltransferase